MGEKRYFIYGNNDSLEKRLSTNKQTDELASLIHTLYISGAQGVLLD